MLYLTSQVRYVLCVQRGVALLVLFVKSIDFADLSVLWVLIQIMRRRRVNHAQVDLAPILVLGIRSRVINATVYIEPLEPDQIPQIVQPVIQAM